ncbi:hypothetical protein PLICRDRAFT_44025 [Plicaturopsis crispa FD-325 SS-3]|nr:hypothetical protein PLICRDRAFT_44025 [Plicaturopsis crispa FD-325 SS-3]
MLLIALLALFSGVQSQQTTFSSGSSAVGTKPLITPEFSRYVDAIREESVIPGLSVAIVRAADNTVVELGSWGKRTEDGDPTTDDTLFHLCSVSKAFLSTSMGILMDDFATRKNVTALPPGLAEFTWTTKVKDILPDDWQLMDGWAHEKANIQDILSHVSGLPRHDHSYGPSDTALDVVRRMKYLRPAHELRQKWAYNNQMYALGQHVIGLYAGKPYTEFVQERIFTPLNMSSSTFSLNAAKAGGKMTQAWIDTGRRIPHWLPDNLTELIAGAGGAISSAADMAKWVGTLLNGGVNPHTNATVIPRSVFEAVTTAYAIAGRWPILHGATTVGYGMGWVRYSYLDNEIVAHNGGMPGFSTLVAFSPNNGLGVVVLANAAVPVDDVVQKVFRAFAGISEDEDEAGYASSPAAYSKNSIASGTAPRPANVEGEAKAQKSVPQREIGEYAGTYSNPGYGAFTLCSTLDTSPYCQQVADDFAAVDAQQAEPPTGDQLIGAWSRIWGTHVRFIHKDEDNFAATFPALFPRGYGANSTAFAFDGLTPYAVAKFVVEGGEVVGFGLFRLEGETERERTESSVQAGADVWFDKV